MTIQLEQKTKELNFNPQIITPKIIRQIICSAISSNEESNFYNINESIRNYKSPGFSNIEYLDNKKHKLILTKNFQKILTYFSNTQWEHDGYSIDQLAISAGRIKLYEQEPRAIKIFNEVKIQLDAKK
jgi:hypothetical protein